MACWLWAACRWPCFCCSLPDGTAPIATSTFRATCFALCRFHAHRNESGRGDVLLFGSTWAVNSVVLSGVLAMILASNAVALWMSPGRLWVGYVGVVSALSLAVLVPSGVFLGVAAFPRLAGSILLVFAPILFAGVIFALSLRQTVALHQAFGANIAGAVFGGLAEYNSMLIGFRRLLLVAALSLFYAGSAVFVALSRRYRQTAIALCKTSP